MKNLIVLVLSLGLELQTAFASFPCCRWNFHPKTGQWELQELCEGIKCSRENKDNLEQYLSLNPCESVKGWRDAICTFGKTNLVHFAWGYEHGVRDYLLAVKLAEADQIKVDEEVLFAAALLHDMGGFPPYEKEGVDHAVRSTQVVDQVLQSAGFPMEKAEAVKKAILTHSYYDPTPPQTPEAIVLHDADVLDFLGAVSFARLLSIVGKEKGISSPKDAIKLLTKFQVELPNKLYGGKFTKELGQKRSNELKNILQLISEETFSLGLPLHN